MRLRLFVVALFLTVITTMTACKESPRVVVFDSSTEATTADTKYGKVAGFIDNGVYTYKGIPYAEASRFEAPHAPAAWTNIRSSRHWGPVCPQAPNTGWRNDEGAFFYQWNDGFQREDCLRLNVWTKGLNDGKKRPVLVWFHGGGFTSGSGQEHPGYNGRNLADKGDVVVVTINHRLNVLGHLDLSDFGDKYKYSGNVGLLDIISSLEWVRDNIAYFGGDPDNVTIFGQSGGGAKVTSMLSMPSAQGLFHRAMVMSGSGARGANKDAAREVGRRTAELLGLNENNIDEIQSVPYEQLLTAGNQAVREVSQKYAANNQRGFSWGPVVGGEELPAFFDEGAELLAKDVPLMIGCTLNEFVASNKPKSATTWDEAKAELRESMGPKADKYVDEFRKAYPNDPVEAIFRLDMRVRPAVVAQAEKRLVSGGAPVYLYLFGYQLPTMDGDFHATHNSDIAFYFNNVAVSAQMTGATEEGFRLGDKMSDVLINFAKSGAPSSSALPEWKPFTETGRYTMFFNGDDCRLLDNHDGELIKIYNE